MDTHDQTINIRNRRELNHWARQLNTTPTVLKIAVLRVGNCPALVRDYVGREPTRWQPDLFQKYRPQKPRPRRHTQM